MSGDDPKPRWWINEVVLMLRSYADPDLIEDEDVPPYAPSANEALVLLALSSHARDIAGDGIPACFPSVVGLAKTCRLSERTATRCIENLSVKGYIEVERRRGRTSYYELTDRAFIQLVPRQAVIPANGAGVRQAECAELEPPTTTTQPPSDCQPPPTTTTQPPVRLADELEEHEKEPFGKEHAGFGNPARVSFSASGLERVADPEPPVDANENPAVGEAVKDDEPSPEEMAEASTWLKEKIGRGLADAYPEAAT